MTDYHTGLHGPPLDCQLLKLDDFHHINRRVDHRSEACDASVAIKLVGVGQMAEVLCRDNFRVHQLVKLIPLEHPVSCWRLLSVYENTAKFVWFGLCVVRISNSVCLNAYNPSLAVVIQKCRHAAIAVSKGLS